MPGQVEEEEVVEEAEEVAEEPEEEGFEPLVQPEEEPVAIAVEPISVPEEVEEPEVEEPDVQAELIAELTKQIEGLQKQREEDMQALQDLTALVQEQEVARPAAPVQPGFRANPYVVTITPEEVLRQNLAMGVQPAVTPTPTYQVIPAEVTPETGPSEMMIIGFIITFLALLGWRFVRTVVV